MQYVRERALQNIKAEMEKSTECSGAKALWIAKGSLVFFQDHPEGWNKRQDNFKSEQFVIVGLHSGPNIYSIIPATGGQLRKVNRQQL